MKMSCVAGCAVAALVCASGAAFAQWTTDIDANTVVSALTGDQGTPLSAPGPDGSTWIFHTDSSSGTYKHSLQRLDASGALMFSPPVDVSPTRVNSATFTVDLYADSVGNAYMAYDQAGAIYVQKVNSAGVKQWGDNGVLVPNSSGNVGPQVVGFDDGSAVVAWGATVNLRFQRINSDGTLGGAWAFTETGRAQSASDLVAASGTEFISLWVRAEGTNTVTSRKGLKIQKWSWTCTRRARLPHAAFRRRTSRASSAMAATARSFRSMTVARRATRAFSTCAPTAPSSSRRMALSART
jgi:hypothetical protein